MAEKAITLILLQANRELWAGGPVRLQITDVTRSSIKILLDEPLGKNSHTTLIKLDLLFDAGQVYGISVDAKKHRSAWQLINHRTFVRPQGGQEIEVKEIFMRLMLVPSQPSSSDLDAGYDRLRERGSPMVADGTGLTSEAYLELKPAAKMALLNIDAKLRETYLRGISLLSFIEAVRHVEVDRLFLFARSELKRMVDDSSDFAPAPGHDAPDIEVPSLPAHPHSWKHRLFGAGNLQLSFSRSAEAIPGAGKQVFSVDTDIDLERGLAHVGEFLTNHLLRPKKKTDQTQVYALLFSQGITPAYTIDPV